MKKKIIIDASEDAEVKKVERNIHKDMQRTQQKWISKLFRI